MMDEYKKVKITLLGNSKVGKTALLNRYLEDEFTRTFYPTLVFDLKLKNYEFTKTQSWVKLYFFDIGGDRRFEKISSVYHKNSDITFLVFDITNRDSFENLDYWYSKVDSKSTIYLFGTKSDLEKEREVTYDEAVNNKIKINYFEVSSKDNTNLECINYIVDSFIDSKIGKKGDENVLQVRASNCAKFYKFCKLL